MNIQELKEKVRTERTPRSKWENAVRGYALDMLDNVEDMTRPADSLNLGELVDHCGYTNIKIGLFRAYAWDAAKETSEGGNFLIYTQDIANNIATPSKIKKVHPQGREPKRPKPARDLAELPNTRSIPGVTDDSAQRKGVLK